MKIKQTFIDLIRTENLDIEIPLIQRDYAQGRQSAKNLRENFLQDIYKSLDTDDIQFLDFIYGKNSNYKGKDYGVFVPLDGQQRLTTLFLLHWYLAINDGEYEDFFKLMNYKDQSRFSYQTRMSSKEFCDALVSEDSFGTMEGLFKSDKLPSQIITDKSWFFSFWLNDPTVKGMLVTLDHIHSIFHTTDGFYNKLVSFDNPIIQFYFLDLEKLRLTDDLYIKMNSRGKPLTPFENFKAKFQNHLNIHFPALAKTFSDKIDNQWTDLFWISARKEISKEKPYQVIDDQALNLISYVTRMLFEKDLSKTKHLAIEREIEAKENLFKQIDSVYANESNIKFLFYVFDLFSDSLKNEIIINDYFLDLFSSNIPLDKKVSIFSEGLNLYDVIVKGRTIDHKDRLMLYAVIRYHQLAELKELSISDNLIDYLRTCRNFIFKINQKNQRNKFELTTDLRFSRYQDILSIFDFVFDQESVLQKLSNLKNETQKLSMSYTEEQLKAGLIELYPQYKKDIYLIENHRFFKGDANGIIDLWMSGENIDPGEKLLWIIENIDYPVLCRAFLSVGDYSIQISDSSFGDIFFYGNQYNWEHIFSKSENIGVCVGTIVQELEHLSKNKYEEHLKNRVQKFLTGYEETNYIYYFLNYHNVLSSKYNAFSFSHIGENAIDHRVEYVNGDSLRNIHIGILIDVLLQSNFHGRDLIDDSKSGFISNRVESPLWLFNDIIIHQSDGFWQILIPQDFDMANIVELFNLQVEEIENSYNYDQQLQYENYTLYLLGKEGDELIILMKEFLGHLKNNII